MEIIFYKEIKIGKRKQNETAKENGLHPFRYLEYLFKQLPQLNNFGDSEALEPFMPWSTSLPDTYRVK